MHLTYQEFGYSVIQFSMAVLLSMLEGGVRKILGVGVSAGDEPRVGGGGV